MNSGPFSSDEMISSLNERAFNLESHAIVKEASGNLVFDPLNGIDLR